MNKGFKIFSHIFAMIVCAAAMAMYFILPLWSISATYNVSASQIKTMLGSTFEGYDLDDALPKEGVDVHIRFDINVPVLCTAAFSSGAEGVSMLVDSNIDGITDELVATIGDVTKTVTKNVIKETIKTEIKNQVKDFLNSASSDPDNPDSKVENEVQEILEELDKNGFIDQGADAIIEALYSDNATVTSVTDITVNIVKDAVKELQNSGNEKVKDIEFDEETEKSVRSAIEEVLAKYANKDGSINIDEAMQQYLLDALADLLNKSSSASDVTVAITAASFSTEISSADVETTAETTTATKDEIKSTLTAYINNLISDSVVVYIQAGLIGVFALFAISLFCWLYVFIKSLVKLICGKEGAKLKAAIIFGWMPGLIFMFIPSLEWFIVKTVVVNEIISALSISFFSSGVCAACAALLLIIFSIVRNCIKSDSDDGEELVEETPEEEAEEHAEPADDLPEGGAEN